MAPKYLECAVRLATELARGSIAQSCPLLTPPGPLDDAASAPLAADNPRYEAASPQYQRRYDDDWPRLPFPFFFGR